MAYLNRKQILSAKLPTREVTVEEWGGEVVIRSLSIKQRVEMLDAFMAHEREVDAYNEDQALPEDERKGVAKVDHLDQAIFQLIYSIVDQNNKLMFTMADYEDFKELDYPTTQRLYSAFLELNAPKSVDTLKKN